jgi:exportin-1
MLMPSFYRTQVKIFVDGLFTLNNDLPKFKLNLRDFLIQLKEFSAGDNTELFAEDREIAAEEARRAEREKAMKVGGLMKPSEMDDVEL